MSNPPAATWISDDEKHVIREALAAECSCPDWSDEELDLMERVIKRLEDAGAKGSL